ncbi:hypothetical protein SAMN02799624_04536 [Paenibacillus sp. UNC496MF]|uniref:hypothetical protein n=1 Tax=Paenibacillus sp. UNC496MF TaxID=1502753 RepID=UPI0008F049D2|nr:hypothetical protein [Paenibacillus sp. UNC496MF]SFJ44165.1 hypothetical protein SAMN02799624_04536 [Paenibacillus sp. UNC496MF]
MIRFSGTLARFAVAYSTYSEGGGVYNQEGVYVPAAKPPRTCYGVIQPLSARTLSMDNARFTSDDRLLLSGEPHVIGDKVQYAGQVYRIEEIDDRSGYADFTTYRMKQVSGRAV